MAQELEEIEGFSAKFVDLNDVEEIDYEGEEQDLPYHSYGPRAFASRKNKIWIGAKEKGKKNEE